MKKLTLLLFFLPFFGKSQILYQKNHQVSPNQSVVLTLYQLNHEYIFALDFFGINDCQRKAEVLILDREKQIYYHKYRKVFGCEKEEVYFAIDTAGVKLEDLKLFRYYNNISMETYNFPLDIQPLD